MARSIEMGEASHLDGIRDIEEIAANAVPAAMMQYVKGWRLRYNFGVTRRANSVLAYDHTSEDLTEKIELSEAFYKRLGQPPRFQLCPASEPEGLDKVLEHRGYTRVDCVPVQVAAADEVITKTSINTALTIRISEHCSDPWYTLCRMVDNPYTTLRQTSGNGDVRRQMFERLPQAKAFISVAKGQELIAVGLGVLERGYAGLFNLATHPEHRRQGAASTLLYGLASWAKQRGAKQLYLQVSEANVTALRVYERAGFRTFYSYHYRELLPASDRLDDG